MHNLIDEFPQKCVAIRVHQKLKSAEAIDVLSNQSVLRGVLERIRSDNALESVAKAVRDWIGASRLSRAHACLSQQQRGVQLQARQCERRSAAIARVASR
jgi:hypothetical protein